MASSKSKFREGSSGTNIYCINTFSSSLRILEVSNNELRGYSDLKSVFKLKNYVDLIQVHLQHGHLSYGPLL